MKDISVGDVSWSDRTNSGMVKWQELWVNKRTQEQLIKPTDLGRLQRPNIDVLSL